VLRSLALFLLIMGITASHVLSATTPDDPSFEIQPKHWNSSHAITLNALGSEISGAFANGGGITFGLSADGFITAAAPAGAPSPINFSAGTTSGNIGSVVFADLNGLAFGLNGSTITGSYTQSTHPHTAFVLSDSNGLAWGTNGSTVTGSYSQSTHSHSQYSFSNLNGVTFGTAGSTVTASVSTNYAGVGESVGTVAGTDLALTVNTDGVSILYPKWLTTARGSTDAVGLNSAQTNVTWTVNSSGISLNAGGYAGTGFTSTTTAGTAIVGTHNTVGLSLGVPAFLTTALTTARASTDAIGLNTAQTNVTWTVNSSGLSLNAAGYAGTGTTFNGANISGSITQNSVGLNLSLSVAAPGAAAEQNAINLLGANTAGNTTATGSTIGLSGLNLTLSGTNASQIVISAPPTSSLVGFNGVTVSTAGSTISVGMAMASYFDNIAMDHHSATIDPGGSTIWVAPVVLPFPVSASFLRMAKSMSHVSTTFGGTSANTTFSGSRFHTDAIVLYTQMGGASSMSLGSYTSTSGAWTLQTRIGNGTAGSQYTVTFNLTYPREGATDSVYTTSYNVSSGTYNVSSNLLSNFTGWRFNDMPFAGSLSPGIYWVGFGESSTSSNNGPAGLVGASLGMSWIGVSQTNTQPGFPGVATNTSIQLQPGLGFWTTNANVMTKDSIGLASISAMASNIRPYFQLIRRA
jgi:hypothetical protein